MRKRGTIVKLPLTQRCDVLVIGCGIAGLTAALRAAEAGCAVILVSGAKLFSGSSFYPGTWGLGLIGPEDESDQEDLARTIQDVGCGMADPDLVRTFVGGISPAIERVRAMGVHLRRAANKDQKEFIPCFDHKSRDWNGIEFDSARQVFGQRIEELGIQVLEYCEVLQLVKQEDRVCGAVVLHQSELHYLGCRALVLASGGYGSLFRYHLCTEDITGLGQALALDAGCSLVNVEFMQMMPGYLSPAPKTIFNEKTFRFVQMHRMDGSELLPQDGRTQRLLALRSTHGPFTARLESREIDLALFRAFTQDPRGVKVTYSEEIFHDPPEFITTYFDWLKSAKGLTPADPIYIGIFAHAANGGIAIQPDTSTGVDGLFACGEATGGMHGADRIGGLSTANGLVFGGRAGDYAAAACCGVPSPPEQYTLQAWAYRDSEQILPNLQEIMFRNAMILRNEQGLTHALRQIDELEDQSVRQPCVTPAAVARFLRLSGQLTTARCILTAALLRKESRGSHYREDASCSSEHMSQQILLCKKSGIQASFRKA